MNRKNFGILLLLAGIFVILAVVGRQQDNAGPIAGDSAGSPFFDGLADDLDDVEQILIDGAGGERLVSLERVESDWRVVNLGGYPAERSQVSSLLIALGDARIVEEKTANPEFHSRLGVEDIASADAAGIEVALVTAVGDRYSTIIGDRYNNSERYARISGSDQSVLIDSNPDIPTDPSDWVVREILDVDAGRIQRVEIEHADGESLTMRKESPDDANFSVDDVPADRELQYAGVANVTANLLQSLRLDLVEPSPQAAAESLAVVEFFTFDGLVVAATAEAAGENEDPWLSFSARFDSDQALAFAADGTDSDTTDTAEAEDTTRRTEESDLRAEADAINARLAGWRYRIPSYQYSQLTRRMEDLLQAEADE